MVLMRKRSIDTLRPKVRELARRLVAECKKRGFVIRVVRGRRSVAQQEKYYAQGRTKPGLVITSARGGYSFHNYGVAFDIRPVEKDEKKKKALYREAGRMGKKLGLVWGGDWKRFPDMPHFQYTAGYSVNDFRKKKVDLKIFSVSKIVRYRANSGQSGYRKQKRVT